MWRKKVLNTGISSNADYLGSFESKKFENDITIDIEEQKGIVKEIKFQESNESSKDTQWTSMNSKNKIIFEKDSKKNGRNSLVFDNLLLLDKTSHGYIDCHRVIDNVKDIKSMMKKQKREKNIMERKHDTLIDEEDENEENSISVCIQKAKSQYMKGQVDSAVMYLKAAIDYGKKELGRSILVNIGIEELTMSAYLLISQCYLIQGKPKESLQLVEKILRDKKDNTLALYVKAESYFFMSKFERALMYYHQGSRLRNFLYSQEFRMGIAKTKDAINKSLKILDHVSEAFAQKSILMPSFKNQAEIVKELNRFKLKSLNQSKIGSAIVVASKKAISKQSIPRISSKIFINRVIPKRKGAPLDPNIRRLQIEQNFLDDVLQSIDPENHEYKNNRKQKKNRKRNTSTTNPQNILKYTNETLQYIDKRKAFWASLSSNESIQKDCKKYV